VGLLEGSVPGFVLATFVPLMMMAKLVVENSCYVDDRHGASELLRSMPLRASSIVVAKYATGLTSILLGYAEVGLIWVVLRLAGVPVAPFSIWMVCLSFASLMLYLAFFLRMFFKDDLAAAHQAPQALALVFFAVLFGGERLATLASGSYALLVNGGPLLLATAAMSVYALSCWRSIGAFTGEPVSGPCAGGQDA